MVNTYNDIQKFNSLSESINYILQYYADSDNELYIVVYQKFWNFIDFSDFNINNILIYYAEKINVLIERTQDFNQYEHNYMPIRLKFALTNIRNIVNELHLTEYIKVEHIKLKPAN